MESSTASAARAEPLIYRTASRPRLGIILDSVSVRRGKKWVLRDISLRLRAGERWALVGGNGAGKTQLLKLLSTAVWPTPTGRERRIYRLGGVRCDVIDAKPRIAYVGAELQDKYARYGWNLTVFDLTASGLHRTDLLLQAVLPAERRQVLEILQACGLSRLAKRRFLTLSYGQQRLAILARALVQDPDWLLLDEFYNGLDRDYRARINVILRAAWLRGQSWVAAAHRAIDVPQGTSRMLRLAEGRALPASMLRATDLLRLSDSVAGSALPAASAPTRRSRGQPVVHVVHADLYVDYRLVLRDVNWEIRRGQHWALFGPNGSGKSSLLKMLYGDLSPALGGVIERRGHPAGTPIAAWKRHVGYVSPGLQADYTVDVSLLELVASGRHASIGLAGAFGAADRRHAARWLGFFGLGRMAGHRPRELSYGQLRRALIARAMAADARVLLLDEPLTGLDPAQRTVMKRLLQRLMAQRVTVIMATHHADDLPPGMTHALYLHNQRATAMDLQFAT